DAGRAQRDGMALRDPIGSRIVDDPSRQTFQTDSQLSSAAARIGFLELKAGVLTMEPIGSSSPRFTARMGGVFYVLLAMSGGLAVFARRGLIVAGDAATTAANILAHQSMYLLAFAGDLLFVASYLAVTALFYRMPEPLRRSVSF